MISDRYLDNIFETKSEYMFSWSYDDRNSKEKRISIIWKVYLIAVHSKCSYYFDISYEF
jgi:hypothetical protein